MNLRSNKHHPHEFTTVCSSIPNSSRSRKILSVRLRQPFFFLPGSRVIYIPNSSDLLFCVHGSSAIYRQPNIGVVCAKRFSAVRDLLTNFRLDRCIGCPDSSVRESAFPGRRSRAFRDQISARGTTYRNSSLYQRELQCYRLTFSYPAICQYSYPKAIKLDVRVHIYIISYRSLARCMAIYFHTDIYSI